MFTDVAIQDARIAGPGRFPRSQPGQVIDADGLIVSPGFIDVHTHADNLVDRPAAANFVRMGVTTIVAGNCGGSALDVGAALSALRESPGAVNFATLIGHNTSEPRVGARIARRAAELRIRRSCGDGRRRGRLLDRPAICARLRQPAGDHRLARVAAGGICTSHM